jgi:hypothetical protein
LLPSALYACEKIVGRSIVGAVEDA